MVIIVVDVVIPRMIIMVLASLDEDDIFVKQFEKLHGGIVLMDLLCQGGSTFMAMAFYDFSSHGILFKKILYPLQLYHQVCKVFLFQGQVFFASDNLLTVFKDLLF